MLVYENPASLLTKTSEERKSVLLKIFGGCILFLFYAFGVLPEDSGHPPAVKPSIYPVLYKGMILVPVSQKKALHIHHWVLCAIFVWMCILANKKWYFWLTFAGLAAMHGLWWYEDSLEFVQKNPWYNAH